MSGKGMPPPKGIDWSKAAFVVSHRADLLPNTQGQALFSRECEKFKATTYTEVEYPLDVPIVCNMCASQITWDMEQNSSTLTLYDFPIDVKVRFIEMAQKRGIPVEKVVQAFVEWKLGKPIQAGHSIETEGERSDPT